MADFIGTVEVPEVAPNGVFPLVSSYGYTYSRKPEIITHQFLSANGKISQRFVLGDGMRRWTIVLPKLTRARWQALQDFWEARHGPYEPFTFAAPNDDRETTTDITARFDVAPLEFQHLASTITTAGLTLVEVPDPDQAPVYHVASTVERFPSSALSTGLLSQRQVPIPLVKVTVRERGYPALYFSDRRCTVGGDLYHARLLRWEGISQGMNGEADEGIFVFGNADKVMRDLATSTNLDYARIDFSLYYVNSQIKQDLWSGRVGDYEYGEGPEFTVQTTDFLRELALVHPQRTISQQCSNRFNDGLTCRYQELGTPGFTSCPRSWPDCEQRGMTASFAGIKLDPQRVTVKDNSTGTWGISRRLLSPLSLVNDGVNGQALQEIYTDIDMPVKCLIAAGRDEGEFYCALGIVGAGPISSFSPNFYRHTLDGQSAHGEPMPLGLRRSEGHHPAENNRPDADSDIFGLGQVDPSNSHQSIYPGATKAAGVAFVEIRRKDEVGAQLSKLIEHQMETWVSGGLRGFTWTAPGDRSETVPNVNPIWIGANVVLRATGLNFGIAAEQEALIDIPHAVASADICNIIVDRSAAVPGLAGTERQFTFRGVLADQRPLRDWLQDILACCLGYYVQSSGKVKFGIRVNSSAVAAFTAGNVILGSIRIRKRSPSFNCLEVTFGDSDSEWQPRTFKIEDFTHADLIGNLYPQKLTKTMNLVGCSTVAQAGRIAATVLREELGGVTPTEWRKACTVELSTTPLGLDVEPGMVCSLTHDEAPGGYVEFRVERWRLNPDYSITISGRNTTDSMYDLVAGPKPADVTPAPVPGERHWATLPPQPWFPYVEQAHVDNPLVDETDWKFRLQWVAEIAADGTALARLVITGLYPPTKVLDVDPPRIDSFTTSATGGSIASGKYATIALTAIDAAGNETRSSQPAAIPVAVGTDTNKVVLSGITWPDTTTGYRLYASGDHNIVSLQVEDFGSQPESIDVTGFVNYRTKGLPRPDMKTLQVRVTVREHAGVLGVDITEVAAGALRVADIGWTTDEWIGRVVSIITDRSDGSAQLWDFAVTSNTEDTLFCSPDPQAAGVEALDTLIIRAQATIFSDRTIGDAKFRNSVYPNGANPGEEVGRVVRIIHGTGAGQVRRIAANDETTLTVDSPWNFLPDETSIFVVDQAAPESAPDIERLANEVVHGQLSCTVPMDNFLRKTVVVEVVPITRDGREPARAYNVWREIYVYGSPGELELGLIPLVYLE